MSVEILNPFDSTFELLHSLRDEITELRCAIQEEARERMQETSEIRQSLIENKHARNTKFEEVCNTVQELSAAKNQRFDRIEAFVEEFRAMRNESFDELVKKVELEITQRETADRALDKTIQLEISHIAAFCQKISKEIQEHRGVTEVTAVNTKAAHEDLAQEVDKLACILRDNSMTRDPMKHFSKRPGTSSSAQTPTPFLAERGARAITPLTIRSPLSRAGSPSGVNRPPSSAR